MRRKVSLYIADQVVDLGEDSLILLNYTFEDLSNPTTIKNSYSKTISLEGTKRNNAVFGEIWRVDRKTKYGDTFSGVYFDATRKTPFKILDEMETFLMGGYCKLTAVERQGDSLKYSISLFGGLGSFFYNLSFNEDGTKRTLADLTYTDMNGDKIAGTSIVQGEGRAVVLFAWDYLKDPDNFTPFDRSDLYYNIVNYAPCYNGLPADFDANKAIVLPEEFDNVPASVSNGGKTYTKKAGTNHLLLTFDRPLTEWEVGDLRWYLQRPVFNLKALLNAIQDPANTGDYSVEIDSDFFNNTNPVVGKGWVTLPMIAKADRASKQCIVNVLKASLTPAEYLISLAKMYGLVFITDEFNKKVTMMPRKKFFASMAANVIDLTGRIDRSQVKINPNVADHRFYQMGGAKPVLGEWAKGYKTEFNREFGIQRINTGYEFDLETTVLTKDMKLAEAVDVVEYSKGFTTGVDLFYKPPYKFGLVQPSYTGTKAQYWRGDNESFDYTVLSMGNGNPDNTNLPFYDWLPKIQFHDDGNKAVKGENVLVFFRGTKRTPNFPGRPDFNKPYFVTDDDPDMVTLNENRPCWDMSKHGYFDDEALFELPSFSRVLWTNDGKVESTFDYGVPFAYAIPGLNNPDGMCIYKDYWNAYLSDRFDTDTVIMKCKANLNGLEVNQKLLGRFFWYENSLWVLNKVENFSLTTDDLVECEFIKVKNKTNYTE